MKRHLLHFFGFIFLLSASSCIKQKFDAPPVGGQDPNVVVNFSIDSLVNRCKSNAGSPYLVTEPRIIEAVVVGDDKSGTFYKQLILQDSTAGITIVLDASNLYTAYPQGRRLFINLQGLYIVNYRGTFEIVAGVNPDGTYAGIPPALFDQFVMKGSFPHPVKPLVKHIYELDNTMIDELIELDGVEFATLYEGKPYADGNNKVSKSVTVEDCNGASITAYNSGYADFANTLTPTGNGTMLCIYGTYNGTPQIQIREVTDLSLTGARCH